MYSRPIDEPGETWGHEHVPDFSNALAPLSGVTQRLPSPMASLFILSLLWQDYPSDSLVPFSVPHVAETPWIGTVGQGTLNHFLTNRTPWYCWAQASKALACMLLVVGRVPSPSVSSDVFVHTYLKLFSKSPELKVQELNWHPRFKFSCCGIINAIAPWFIDSRHGNVAYW